MTRKEVLGAVLGGVIAARGFPSPEAFAAEHDDEPYSGSTLRHIRKGDYGPIRDDDRTKYSLLRLDTMLGLPLNTLWLSFHCDAGAVARMAFEGKDAELIKQYVVHTIEQAVNPPRDRRAEDRKRSTG